MTDNQHEINAEDGSPDGAQSGTDSFQATDLSTFLTFRLSRLQANLNGRRQTCCDVMGACRWHTGVCC